MKLCSYWHNDRTDSIHCDKRHGENVFYLLTFLRRYIAGSENLGSGNDHDGVPHRHSCGSTTEGLC